MRNTLWYDHDDVIKWKQFPRSWPFVQVNSPVTGEFPAQQPVTRSFRVSFDLRLIKWLSKQSWGSTEPFWIWKQIKKIFHVSFFVRLIYPVYLYWSAISIVIDDVTKGHFPRYWPFVRAIRRSPVNFPHKDQWRGPLIFSLICTWIKGWVNNRKAGDLRRHRTHYGVTVMVIGRVLAWGHMQFGIPVRNSCLTQISWNRVAYNIHLSCPIVWQ